MDIPRVRVGLDLLYLQPGVVGGTESYAAGLLDGLADADFGCDFCVYVGREALEWPLPREERFRRVECPVSASNQAARYFYQQTSLPRLLRRDRIGVVHSLGYVAPLVAPCRSVVTVHDLNFCAPDNGMSAARRLALGGLVRLSVSRADHVLTISEYSCGLIRRQLNVDPAKVSVTHLAARPLSMAAEEARRLVDEAAVPTPYIVAFAAGLANKNIPRLIEAYRLACQTDELTHALVLVGGSEISPAGGRSEGRGRVIRLGRVGEALKWALLARATALVMPSTYEGFGLPVVEAMACGTPVACSIAAALPEVAGTGALLFDPTSVSSISSAIARVALDHSLQEQLRRLGLENARRFSWRDTARLTSAVYLRLGREDRP